MVEPQPFKKMPERDGSPSDPFSDSTQSNLKRDDGDSFRSTQDFNSSDGSRNSFNFESTNDPIETPTHFGRYRVGKLLGSGGFGAVFEGFDETLQRTVAIKVPRLRAATDDQREQFLNEARRAAKLRHPGIVLVYDFGVAENGCCYVIYEYLSGKSLKQLVEKKEIKALKLLAIMIQVADALQEAHKQGVVHRDLKPANIMLDDKGDARICDFGLAVDEATQRAYHGDRSGTLAYMSPEQLRGEVHYFDGRTDIWALGVMLYEFFVGRRPFQGNSTSDVILEIQQREVRPPRQLNDRIPRRLELCILRCLSKKIADRFPTAMDVVDELKGILAELETASDSISLPGNVQSTVVASLPGSKDWLLLTASALLGTIALSLIFVVFNRQVHNPSPIQMFSGKVNEDAKSEPPIEASNLLEKGLNPYEKVSLLKFGPNKLIWPPDDKAELLIDAENKLFEVRPVGNSILDFGKTNAESFCVGTELQIGIDQNPQCKFASAGIVFGYGVNPSNPDEVSYQAVTVNYIQIPDAKPEWSIQRTLQRRFNNLQGKESKTTLLDMPIPAPISMHRLLIEINDHKLSSVKWLPSEGANQHIQLTDKQLQSPPGLEEDLKIHSESLVGVVVSSLHSPNATSENYSTLFRFRFPFFQFIP